MIFISGTINLTRLKNYYSDLQELFDSVEAVDEDLSLDVFFHIDSTDQEKLFTDSFSLLMQKYKIAEEHWDNITYICQLPTRELHQEEETDPETDSAIRFLRDYQLLKQGLKEKKKLTDKQLADIDPFIIQVKEKISNGGINLNYHGSAPLVMNLIYRAFKTSFANPSLSHLLETHSEIPSAADLEDMLPEGKIRKLLVRSVQNTAEILTHYFIQYLPEKVYSRKKNLIIFELLYLFGTLKYGGKIAGKEMSKLPERTLEPVYSLPVSAAKCTAIIKELLKKDIS